MDDKDIEKDFHESRSSRGDVFGVAVADVDRFVQKLPFGSQLDEFLSKFGVDEFVAAACVPE